MVAGVLVFRGWIDFTRQFATMADPMTDDEQPKTMRRVLTVLVIVALAAGVWFAKPAYRAWKKSRQLANANRFLAAADLKNAALSARQVLVLDPANLDASLIMARLTQQLRSPEAVTWWQRVVDLDPQNPTNLIALAEAALIFSDFNRAQRALALVPPDQRASASFHQTAALTLAGQRKLAEAEAHLAAGLKLAPTNELLRLNRAVILLQAQDPQLVQQGLATLEAAATNSAYPRMALQNLIQAYLQTRQFDRAIAAADQLVNHTNVLFAERMLRLSALNEAHAPAYTNELAAMQRYASEQGQETVQALATWLLATGQTPAALQWLEQLPPDLRSQQRVSMVRADLHLARSEWAQLQSVLESAEWHDAEFMRHALLARALREQRQSMSATAEWLSATRAVTGQPRLITMLARLAAEWRWADEEQELLWILVERHPSERWAATRLSDQLFAAGDTRGLNRLYGTLYEQNPENLVAKNNYAGTLLLLTPQSIRGRELARELFQRNPSNAVFASTHSFALHLQGDQTGAVQAYAAVDQNALAQPSIALYYALAQGTNSPADARRYLSLAATGKMLPEERALLEELRRELP